MSDNEMQVSVAIPVFLRTARGDVRDGWCRHVGLRLERQGLQGGDEQHRSLDGPGRRRLIADMMVQLSKRRHDVIPATFTPPSSNAQSEQA